MIKNAIAAFRDGGLPAVGRKVRFGYCHVVETYVRPYTPRRETTVLLNGVEVVVDRSLVDHAPFFTPSIPTADNPDYESAEVEAIGAYCRTGDHVVIVGGGVGVTAVTAARVVGPDGRVTAFEPSDTAFAIARRTVERNGCSDRVRLVNASIGTPQKSCFTYRMQRDVTMVDYAELPDADVYEMDCEGEELPILQHMPTTPRTVLVETHGNHTDVVGVLRRRGYAIDGVVGTPDGTLGEAAGSRTHVRAVLQD